MSISAPYSAYDKKTVQKMAEDIHVRINNLGHTDSKEILDNELEEIYCTLIWLDQLTRAIEKRHAAGIEQE
jgi:hypothetical protein